MTNKEAAADMQVWAGQCHCGAVGFEATLGDGLASALRCTCSFCRMRGAVVVMADAVRITQGAAALTSYRFNSGAAQHFFCARCGIYTHHRRRSDPDTFGVNAACLAGVSPFDFAAVPVTDGINHPSDTGGLARRAGTLRFVPTG